MKLALVVIVVSAATARADRPIVGGVESNPGQFPAVGVITQTDGDGTATCTGTLIAPTWVLTAAHCVFQAAPQNVTVLFGVQQGGSGELAQASVTIPNDGYLPGSFGTADVGLIELTAPITDIAPAVVNFTAANAPVGSFITTVGFGDDHLGTQAFYDNTSSSCGSDGDFFDSQLLCFQQTATLGTGGGDSGGPTLVSLRGHLIEVAATSFMGIAGSGSDATLFGGVQRTDAYAAWIQHYVPATDCTQASCPTGLACVDGSCVGATCSQDSDCDSTQACFDGGCMVKPFTQGGLGSSCSTSADCDSSDCLMGAMFTCTLPCSLDGEGAGCPAGFECSAALDLGVGDPGNGGGYCVPGGGGCCSASGDRASGVLGLAVLLFITSKARRSPARRRRRAGSSSTTG